MVRHIKSSEKPNVAQVERFREKASELETNDDEAGFEEKLKRLAKAKAKKEDSKN